MATQVIGGGGLTVELKLRQFQKRLISRNRAETHFMRPGLGVRASIGRRMGKAISFRRMESIYPAGNAGSLANASAPAALTEGTQPAAINPTFSEVQATASQYGGSTTWPYSKPSNSLNSRRQRSRRCGHRVSEAV